MMLSKNELKYIQSLCHKKHRQAEQLFIAEGPKLVGELLLSHYTIKKLFATETWIQQNQVTVATTIVTEAELVKLSALQTPNQVLAVVEQRHPVSPPVLKDHISLVLDGIQDPGNLGTIIRIADWFGINQVIAGPDTVEFYNPKVIQATMGSFMRVNCWYEPLVSFLQKADVPVYGALLDGASLYQQAPLTEGLLVIGNESKGIRDEILPFITKPVTIPRIGGAESLNAAVAAGILLSHLVDKQVS